MKVDELRKIVKKYNEEEKEKIIEELYKRVPKRIKEEYEIDEYITNLTKKVEKQEKDTTIEKKLTIFLNAQMMIYMHVLIKLFLKVKEVNGDLRQKNFINN